MGDRTDKSKTLKPLKSKKWYNVELPRAESEKFKAFLIENRFIFEPSDADGLVHFEIYAYTEGAAAIKMWLRKHNGFKPKLKREG